MANETVLFLSGIGVPPYSARGVTQTLEPIDQAAQLLRTINGGLKDLSAAKFRKYKSTITGNDQTPPSCDGVFPGRVITVDCVAELAFVAGGTPQRLVVPGSDYTADGFTFYRPRLRMFVMGFSLSKDEYGAVIGWSMSLEEE
jgi:hypothetical protein